MKHKGANIEARDNLGNTPLHCVCNGGYKNRTLARYLLGKGANPEARNDEGRTPLHLAARTGDTDTISLLLDNGANIEARDTQ